MLINAVSLLSVVFLLLLIEQVNTEGVNIKLDMEGDDASEASEGGKVRERERIGALKKLFFFNLRMLC